MPTQACLLTTSPMEEVMMTMVTDMVARGATITMCKVSSAMCICPQGAVCSFSISFHFIFDLSTLNSEGVPNNLRGTSKMCFARTTSMNLSDVSCLIRSTSMTSTLCPLLVLPL